MSSLQQFVQLLLCQLSILSWHILLSLKELLRMVRGCARPSGIASGKNVLVTTGRQAKTLHTTRALAEVGAKVVVADYDFISASVLSLSCDKFELLPPLDADRLLQWVAYFEQILVKNDIDMVLPVSTINEVLFVAVAKQMLQTKHPHITWICPDLETALLMDDRLRFAKLCDAFFIPSPEHGMLTSRDGIADLANSYKNGVILKRVESSVNRNAEIVHVKSGESIPESVNPSEQDVWQWQQYVKGEEYSVWYICVDGNVTFAGCYHSEADLVHFDGAKIPEDVDVPLQGLINKMKLTGQFAFDFIRDEKTGLPFVIECNPRASSVLETVSNTPLWAEAFFGVDVTKRTVHSNVGFLYHRNCWPFSDRQEGFFDMNDPLPFFGGEIAWPLHAIAEKGLTEKSYQKIDVNICKIIVDGLSTGRDLQVFRDQLTESRLRYAEMAAPFIDTLFIDTSLPNANIISSKCEQNGGRAIPFSWAPDGTEPHTSTDCVVIRREAELNELINQHANRQTRLLLGEELSRVVKSPSYPSYRVVKRDRGIRGSRDVPLRKLRVLHVMGSCTSEYYEGLSAYYGFQCIQSIGSDGRFDHIIAYVHRSGKWTIGVGLTLEGIQEGAETMTPGEAIAKVESLNPDVALPHMFDYDGLTAYRGLFTVLDIPIIGCSGEALALSTHKARTKACAEAAGVRVPRSQIVRRGDKVTMSIPFVVKPVEEDNSQGISVVWKPEEMDKSLEHAFQFEDEVMCEEFVPLGRELRAAVIERGDGEMEMLPVIEYFLSKEKPIRRPEDKVVASGDGKVTGLASGGRACPADVDDLLREKLEKACITAHRALGCRDYSIFDFRISPRGEPYMLESCLYCSFAPKSVLVSMQAAIGIGESELFVRLCEQAISRKKTSCSEEQKFGMKQR